MKTILVTGGAGYIGSHTVKELIKANYSVVVLDNLESGHKEAVDPKASLEIVDLKDKSKILSVFDKYEFDAVIDFAAYLAVGESMEKPEKYLENNVLNFINLLDVMVEKKCKCVIKSSTASVYGNPTKESDIPWQENFVENYQPLESALLNGVWQEKKVIGKKFFGKFINAYRNASKNRPELKLNGSEITKLKIPLSIYGLTKLLDEILLKKYDEISGIKSVSLRYFNVCGADPGGEMGEDKPNPTTLMILCIMQILEKIPELKVFGNDYSTNDGTGIRDYIHVSDIAAGHVSALANLLKNKKTNVFNLGTGQGSTVMEVINSVNEASGKKVEFKIVERRSGDPTVSIANPNKAEKELNWKARYSINDMARTAWKWHNSHPNGYRKTKELKN